jgi:hypothetical protein
MNIEFLNLLNPLCSYLKQTKMSFSKNVEQEDKPGPVWWLVPVAGGDIWKQSWRLIVAKILCTHA